jgi:hypothetical protein
MCKSEHSGFGATPSNWAIERFQAKWRPVRVKKTHQIKNLEPRFDSIETEKAPGVKTGQHRATRENKMGVNRLCLFNLSAVLGPGG